MRDTETSPVTAASFRLTHAVAEVPRSTIALVVGLAALIIPTIVNLARWSWSSDMGAHGPIVLATGLWLIWRDRGHAKDAVGQPFLPAGLLLVALLPLYIVSRITGLLMVESLALYCILLVVAYLQLGGRVLLRFWFPCVYLLFLITPPNITISVATRPIKMLISSLSVDLLSWFGMAVGSTGSTIQIDGYQVQVAAACSGVNSLIGITAITLFYVYLFHGAQPRYAAVLTVLLLPLAIFTNFLRVLILLLVTHWLGQDAAAMVHDAAALGMFGASLLLLFVVDGLLHPAFRRLSWARA